MNLYQTEYHNRDLKDLSFLVTGGAGFIGSNLVEYLLKFGAGKVRVLDSLSTGKKVNVDLFSSYENFEFLEGDIRDYDTCLKACEGIDLISHQAALGSVPRSIADPIASNASNIDGFVNMLTAMKETGLKRMVYASSSSVYGDEPNLPKVEERVGTPLSPYAVTKKANELYASVFSKIYGVELIGLRYFNIFGPRQDPYGAYAAVIPLFVKGILEGNPPYIDGDGSQTRDFTFVENAVQANIKAMLTDNSDAFGEVFNIAVSKNFSVKELYDNICEYLGAELEPHYREPRKGDIKDSLADISKAEKLLNYDPKFDFKEGLGLTIEYFKSLFLAKI